MTSRFDGQRPRQIDAQVDPEAAPHDDTKDRRYRDIASAQRQIAEVVSQKVLHGWLQNRHQTIIPLNINIGRLPASEAEAVVRFAAVAALAGGAPGAPERVRDWLAAAGAAPDLLGAYTAALGVPPALNAALSDVTRSDLALIVFVLALVAARDAGPAARAFADYIALHCALPTSTVRAAIRRYRV